MNATNDAIPANDTEPHDEPADAPGPPRLGEVPASTGGVVDLDRIVGRIPVALVFLSRPGEAAARELIRGLGDHLADFGHDRVQVLGVIPFPPETTEALDASTSGNARILADPDRSLAAHFGIDYSSPEATTVLLDADGEVAARWTDQSDGTFADRLLERVSELT